MKKMITACALALTAVAGMAQTTTDANGVTTSTDPAKAAAVERQAAELKSEPAQKVAASGTSSAGHARHHARHHRHHKAAAK
jgi:hypothetical protein